MTRRNTRLQPHTKVLYAAILLAFALSSPPAVAGAIRTDVGFTQNTLGPQDDFPSVQVGLPFDICFFGETFHSLWVNNNGNVTFNAALSSYVPSLNILNNPIIAPFFADVDTRPAGSGQVTYGVSTINDDGGSHTAFGVNWVNVGYFSQHVDKLNSFQLVIYERADLGPGDFDFEFNYDSIQWDTGDFSQGKSALVGYSNGSGTTFNLPGSLVNGAFINGGPFQLIASNGSDDNVPGRLEFECRNCRVLPEPGSVALIGLALCGIGAVQRRRNRAPGLLPA